MTTLLTLRDRSLPDRSTAASRKLLLPIFSLSAMLVLACGDKNTSPIHWVWAGGITENAFRVTTKLRSPSDDVRLLVSSGENLAEAVAILPTPRKDSDPLVNAFDVNDLQPSTTYRYGIEVNGIVAAEQLGEIRTLTPGPFSFKFAFGSCARTGSNSSLFEQIQQHDPLLFLHLGDFHYEDIEENDPDKYRDAYDEVLTSPTQSALYRSTAVEYVWDDHDFGPNNSDSTHEGRGAAQTVYREVVPHRQLLDDEAIYRAFTIGRARFIVTDSRSYKTDRYLPDTPEKSVLGTQQKAWLQEELLAANGQYPLIFWVSTMPWIAEADGDADHWGGYTHERLEISQFIEDNDIRGLVMLSGDAHMLAIDDGSNNRFTPNGGPGFPVMHAAALDKNGSEKGGPYSEGVFEGGGQFGLVTVDDDGSDTVRVLLSGRNKEGEELVGLRLEFPVLPIPEAE